MDIKTFVFLDLETTGLPRLDGNTTKITEMCLIAVESDHFRNSTFRVRNKLSMCFNPEKNLGECVSKLTGFSDTLLKNQSTFKAKASVMTEFLDTLAEPICFVAHNGIRFDYPILKAELYSAGKELPVDVLCIDSAEAFKALDQNGVQSYSLGTVYTRLTGKAPVGAHEAEADTLMMMECAGLLGQRFANWANLNVKNFSEIARMVPSEATL